MRMILLYCAIFVAACGGGGDLADCQVPPQADGAARGCPCDAVTGTSCSAVGLDCQYFEAWVCECVATPDGPQFHCEDRNPERDHGMPLDFSGVD